MLKIEDLTVFYPGRAVPVLERLSLDVGASETVAIVGPSGCGKTTLFRAVSGFVPIRAGRIVFDGTDVTNLRGKRLRALRRRVAVIAQQHDLIDGLTVRQNVMAGALGRWSALRALRFLFFPFGAELRDADEALARVGIPKEARGRIAELSGGQQQRVAIARALVQSPALLLADEPVASLDPELSGQILSLLCGLARRNHMALLCSLHQPELARRHFDRVIDLRSSEVIVKANAQRVGDLVFAS